MFIKTDGGMASAGFVERNDCAVRAYSIYSGISYAASHKMFSDAGREKGQGTSSYIVRSILGKDSRLGGHRLTLAALRRQYPTSTVYMVKRGHAFAMINGVVHDTWNVGGRTNILSYWVKPTEQQSAVCTTAETPPASSRPTSSKQSDARAVFTRMRADNEVSNYAIAKQIARELNITIANAMYYVSKFVGKR